MSDSSRNNKNLSSGQDNSDLNRSEIAANGTESVEEYRARVRASMAKLQRNILKSFPKKKFIGDIPITDEEFKLLIFYLRMPPFFIFKKTGEGRDVQFLGLAAAGNPQISPDKDLVAFWRTMDENRFQNYEAYFTVLNTGSVPISRQWLKALIDDHDNSIQYAPGVWRKYVNNGRNGIEALKAPKVLKIPSKYEQLQSDVEGMKCLDRIRDHYLKEVGNPQGFEACATNIISKMDGHFVDFSLTRPWRDGGRDAIGYYSINTGGVVNRPLKIDCALEAKCYSKDNAVGVKQMSRLISRIRYRQFGILITTSYVDNQAYREVVEDGHPVLIVTAADIAGVLRTNAINASNVDEWLKTIDRQDVRLLSYYNSLR